MKKKRTIAVAAVIATIGLIVVSGFFLNLRKNGAESVKEPSLHERQVEFLKKHESEMNAYIRKNSSSDMKITYDWDSVETSKNMMFDEPKLRIVFDAKGSMVPNNAKSGGSGTGNILYVYTDVNKLKEINKLSMVYSYKKGE